MQIYSRTDIGKKRSSNQDAFFAGELANGAVFAIVCDGMGGANAGNVASETAVKVISDYILRSYRKDMDSFKIERMLQNAVKSANIDIYDMAQKDVLLSGMGTTVVAALIKDDELSIAHIGDSRAYFANEALVQLTRDHSIVQTLLETGKITPEDAKVHPEKNVITRALGVEKDIIVDTNTFSFGEENILLLCTDGLTGYAEPDAILNILKSDVSASADSLVNLALEGGGGDNVTVVVLAR